MSRCYGRWGATLRLAVALAVLVPGAAASAGAEPPASRALPEFTHADPADWINSEPLRVDDLRGKVLLVDFWTFECWNCYRSFPWLKALEARLAGTDFQVIGVHSPELERERDRARVARKVEEFGLRHPVMIDNDFSYWRAMGNRYWPTFYLVDRNGRIRARYIGETHAGDRQAEAIERQVRELLERGR